MATGRAKRKAKKALKKIHFGYIAVIAIALAVGIIGGYLVGNFIYGKDTLELKGEKITYIETGKSVSYADEGIKYISNGKDMSKKVEISTNMAIVDGKYVGTPDSENELYIIYTVTAGRAKGETLYRVFRVSENGGES